MERLNASHDIDGSFRRPIEPVANRPDTGRWGIPGNLKGHGEIVAEYLRDELPYGEGDLVHAVPGERPLLNLIPKGFGDAGVHLHIYHGLFQRRGKQLPKVIVRDRAMADRDVLAPQRALLDAEAAVMRVWYDAGRRVQIIKHKCGLRCPGRKLALRFRA